MLYHVWLLLFQCICHADTRIGNDYFFLKLIWKIVNFGLSSALNIRGERVDAGLRGC